MPTKEQLELLKSHLNPQIVAFIFLVVFGGLAIDSLLGLAVGSGHFLADLLISLLFDFLIAAGLVTLLLIWVGTRIVSGVVEPVEKSHDVLKTLAQGDLSDHMVLEKGQLLESFCGDLNFAVANLREFVAEDRFRLQHAAELLRSLARSHPEIYDDVENLIHGTLAKVTKKMIIEDGDQGPDLSSDATGVYRGLKRQKV